MMGMEYSSTVRVESESLAGVWFEVRRMSLGRRIDMSKRIRELSTRMDFAEAGSRFSEKLESSSLALEIERVYLEWGIDSVGGLSIDGEPATLEAVIERGPESLYREMVEAVRRECGLSEEERKN
jgi:hypothetical protein